MIPALQPKTRELSGLGACFPVNRRKSQPLRPLCNLNHRRFPTSLGRMSGMGDKQPGAVVTSSRWLTLSEKTVLPLLTVIGALNLALLIGHSDVDPLIGAMPVLFLGIVSIGGLANLHWVKHDLPPLRTVRILVVVLSLAGLGISLSSVLQFEGAVALSSPDYARDPDSSGLGTRKNAVAL